MGFTCCPQPFGIKYKGNNSAILFCPPPHPPSQWDSSFKGKNLLLLEQILSFKSIHHFGMTYVAQGSKQEVTKLVPLCELAEEKKKKKKTT